MAGLVSPSPADAHTDLLFSTRQGFLANLKSIAGYVVQAATHASVGVPSSMSFAIYGKWGAGKSSALHVLEDHIREAAENSSLKVTFTHFDSPLWERLPDVRPALAYEVVKGISPQALSEVATHLALIADRDTAVLPTDADLKRAVVFLDVFNSIPGAPVLEQWMRDTAVRISGKADGHDSRAHVVMIDDVDRCGLSFTARLLAAMSYWQTTPGFSIFFIIAADKEHLLESLRENLPRGAHNAEQALEKYVDLSVNMPGFLESMEEVAAFVQKLTKVVVDDGTVDPDRRLELNSMIEASLDSYPDCVFAPILELNEANLTPRAIKHRFNTFMAEFQPQAGLERLLPTDLKDWIIKAFWPEFWWRFVWKLKVTPRDQNPRDWDEKADWVDRLTALGKDLLDVRRLGRPAEDTGATAQSLAASKGLDLQGIDPTLIMYLAVDPIWQRPPIGSPGPKTTLIEVGGQLRREDVEERVDHLQREEGLNSEDQAMPSTPDDQVFFFLLLGEAAHNSGDDAKARHSLLEIIKIIRQGGLKPRSAGTVGNAGLLAERMREGELGLELHNAAYNLDPTHWNEAQNFVECIIDEEATDLYQLAKQILGQLQTAGKQHRPERTSVLALELSKLMAEAISPEKAQLAVNQYIEEMEQHPTLGRLSRVYSLDPSIVSVDQANRSAQIVCGAVQTDDEKYQTLRGLADFLARFDDHAVEAIAIDMYRYFLQTGLACINNRTSTDVKHNLATLLASNEYRNAAALLWQEVYQERPGDQTVRRAFAMTLDRLDREADAAKVLIGQELAELQLTPEALPDQFAPNADRWWGRVSIGSYPPCPSSVLNIVPPVH